MGEAEATRRDNAATVAKFLFESINTRYGFPLELISDRGTHFLNKITTKQTPYFLVYGQQPVLPIEFEVPTHRILDQRQLEAEESQFYQLQEVMVLEERRQEAVERTEHIQRRSKKAYDSRIQPVMLRPGDLALKYDSQHARFPRKLHLRRMGAYKMMEVFSNGSIQLADLSRLLLSTRVNGWRLKK
ncbi:hypothetical protein AXG93_1106s1020 [Marchantia polymorpha subsp. ruderalis]|uniref:Integrase catalytic domain-containing protein n=1 Tax=Marchantia polymorpha subsp. ruderalis TaxID=1480154 RepID=A0A176VCJ3_MARPO|nr:hypothetical protein AXG93_1106s1020 [Marchantia polymorpha subsp. ruderalis]